MPQEDAALSFDGYPTRINTLALTLSLAAFLCAPLKAADDGSRPTVRARRLNGEGVAPLVDGRVDEAAWSEAEPASNFIQQQPDEGRPSTERTEVRVLYDGRTLYLGIICFDSEPDKIVVTQGRRDAELQNSDSVQVVFDTFDDDQNAFLFGTNPLGIEYDGQVAAEGQIGGAPPAATGAFGGSGGATQRGQMLGFNKNWDADWTVKSQITERGWETEMAVPLRTLRYDGGANRRWGINVMRNIRRKNEQAFLAPIPRAYNIYRISLAGDLTGLDLPGRRDLRAVPFGIVGASEDRTRRENQVNSLTDAGLDVKWGITPKLTTDFTVNTDFAQVEADEEQVNLTRFDLFFPEKRPFFLENAGTFQFGQPQEVDLFFSRRIGLGRAGDPIGILGGARLSGKVGSYNVGLMNMQTELTRDEVTGRLVAPANNFTVTRVQREFHRRSNYGAIFVNREGTGEPAGAASFNRSYGLDTALAVSDDLKVFAFLAGTSSPAPLGTDYAGRLYLDYRSDLWEIRGGYTQVGERFNPEAGFVPRVGYLRPDIFVQFGPEPKERFRWIRKFSPHVNAQNYYGFDGELQSERWHIHFFEIQQSNGGRFGIALNHAADRPTLPFIVYSGRDGQRVVIPPALYSWDEWSPQFSTDPSRPVYISSMFTLGGFYDGSREQYNVDLGVQCGGRFQANLGYIRNNVDLPYGKFSTDLMRVRSTYSFTPRMLLQALIQYNSQIAQVSSNIRFAWLSRTGTGLFVVYNDNRDTFVPFEDDPSLLGRALIIKYTRQFDF